MNDHFQELVRDAILSLPQDLKTVLRILEEPDLEDAHRVQCAGALLHVLSGVNSIPGAHGVLSYADDVLVLRIVLAAARDAQPGVIEGYADDAPELIGNLAHFEEVMRAQLGEAMPEMERAAQQVGKLTHQGHSAEQCALDTEAGTWLYDAVHAAIVEQLEFDDDDVTRELRRLDSLLEPLRARAMRG